MLAGVKLHWTMAWQLDNSFGVSFDARRLDTKGSILLVLRVRGTSGDEAQAFVALMTSARHRNRSLLWGRIRLAAPRGVAFELGTGALEADWLQWASPLRLRNCHSHSGLG